MTFVDTNYFLRFLIHDDEKQYLVTRSLFEDGALGKVQLFTSLIVVFELKWVLSSFYRKKKQEVIDILTDILSMRFIQLEKSDSLKEAIILFKDTNLDFEDCYNLVYARKMEADSLATFDRKLSTKFKELKSS